jgi:hypothetical protein
VAQKVVRFRTRSECNPFNLVQWDVFEKRSVLVPERLLEQIERKLRNRLLALMVGEALFGCRQDLAARSRHDEGSVWAAEAPSGRRECKRLLDQDSTTRICNWVAAACISRLLWVSRACRVCVQPWSESSSYGD